MTNYRCKNCSYRFSSQAPAPPRTCPNCGGTGFVGREESAEELVNDED
jgi:rubredoxin